MTERAVDTIKRNGKKGGGIAFFAGKNKIR